MRSSLIVLCLCGSIASTGYQNKIDQIQQKQSEIQKKGVKGFVLEQKVAPQQPNQEQKPIPEAVPEPLRDEPKHRSVGDLESADACVPYETYYRHEVERDRKDMQQDKALEEILSIVSDIQRSQSTTMDAGSFIIKALEIIMAALGSGGIFAGILAYLAARRRRIGIKT